MMPDLGKYAFPVLSAYAVSILLIVAVLMLSLWAAKRARAELDKVERKRDG